MKSFQWFSGSLKMGEKVQIYIYDLSRGMARSLGPAIIGKYALLQLIAIKTQKDLARYARTYLVCLVKTCLFLAFHDM
jgi:hypothetical protein